MKVLISWVGLADLKAMEGPDTGPTESVLRDRSFDGVVILSGNLKNTPSELEHYKECLERIGPHSIHIHQVEQPFNPTDYGAIKNSFLDGMMLIESLYGDDAEISVHVSPGTPHMHVISVLVTKQWYPEAELIQSSREEGVQTVDVPFHVQVRGNQLEQLVKGLPPATPAFDDIVGVSNVMHDVKVQARKIALIDLPVLIEGESGTGKELLARAIHSASNRKHKDLLAINCGALPEGTKESELFGHVKGAFTGATGNRRGYFEQADGGTLFLDEIGELPLNIQVMLLRALQEQEVSPVGTTETRKVDVRIIAATNRNLGEEVGAGRFREDLLYRLNVMSIKMPPLRERADDVALYIDKILADLNKMLEDQGLPLKSLSDGARKVLLRRSWNSGNFRELHNAIAQLSVIGSADPVISGDEAKRVIRSLEVDVTDRILGRPFNDDFTIEGTLGEVVGHYFDRALQEAGGVKTRAARLVGLTNYQRFDSWREKYERWITFGQ